MPKNGSSNELISELRALGSICREQGDFVRAEQHYRLGLKVFESSFPEDHVEAMLCLLGLADVLHAQGRGHEAAELEASIPFFNARRRKDPTAI